MVEKLTDEDRHQLLSFGDYGEHALSIIEAQAAVIERVRALAVPLLDEVVTLRDALAAAPEHTAQAKPCDETGVHKDCDCEDPRIVGYPEPTAPDRAEPTFGSSPVGGSNLRPERRHSIGESLLTAATAKVAELEAGREAFIQATMQSSAHEAQSRIDAANARADAAERALLKSQSVTAAEIDRCGRAESEATALRASIARVKAIWANPGSHQADLYNALEDLCGPK